MSDFSEGDRTHASTYGQSTVRHLRVGSSVLRPLEALVPLTRNTIVGVSVVAYERGGCDNQIE